MSNFLHRRSEFAHEQTEPLIRTAPKPHRAEMIVLAREEKGYSQAELAGLAGISQANLSRLESGLISLSDEVEVKLSQKLDRPPEFFRYQGLIEAPSHVLYRKKATIAPAVIKQFWARITIFSIHLRQLLKGAEITTQPLPYYDPDECVGGVPEIARRIRRIWKLPRGPIRNLMRLVENAGCIVVRMDLGTLKIVGCSGFIDQVPVIFVNSSLSAVRQRLTIAHELGHLIMHRFPSNEAEAQAFLFASELLTPEDEITPMLRPLSFDRLASLKLHWLVSIQALVKRAEGLGLISTSAARYYWSKLTRDGHRDHEPYDDEIPVEIPTLVPEIVDTHLGELNYSQDELAKLVLLNPSQLNSFRGFANHLRVLK